MADDQIRVLGTGSGYVVVCRGKQAATISESRLWQALADCDREFSARLGAIVDETFQEREEHDERRRQDSAGAGDRQAPRDG